MSLLYLILTTNLPYSHLCFGKKLVSGAFQVSSKMPTVTATHSAQRYDNVIISGYLYSTGTWQNTVTLSQAPFHLSPQRLP